MDRRAKELCDRFDRLKGDRGTVEAHWQQISELMRPMRSDFTVKRGVDGEKRMGRVVDGTAILASENLATGLWGMLTNAATPWFEMGHELEAVQQDRAVKAWNQQVSKTMLAALAANGHRFYARVLELFKDLVPLGTGVFYTDERPGHGLRFHCRPLSEVYIAENADGDVDTVFRTFMLTARQAVQRWGAAIKGTVADAAEKTPDAKYPFLHVVLPRGEYDPRKRDQLNHPFASIYIDMSSQTIIAEGGYHEMPYQVPRWSTASGGLYGDGVGMLALPDTAMVNAMSRTTLAGAQKVVDPPLLTADEDIGPRGLRTGPGSIIPGAIDRMTGRPLYQPLQTGGRIELGLDMEEQRRQAIREAFYWSMMIMVATPGATATEVLARQEEKLRLMGPHLSRVTGEFLDQFLDRVFSLLYRAGAFPPPPPLLRQYPQLKMTYVSPLARAQMVAEAGSMVRAVDGLMPMAQLDPSVMDIVDGDAYGRRLFEAHGAPADIIRDPKLVAQIRQQRAEQAEAAQLAQAAPGLARAARDVAQVAA